ncbi:MAG: hypothetical protein M9964_08265 [Solirubrobacterales bacterium]|nr:hypothetical protein [Solirubrobacterales bacterium]
MSRVLRRTALLVLALLALGSLTASAAGTKKKAAVGDYQASPVVASSKNYSVGVFTVERAGKQRRIVRTDGFLGIYYPDDNKCDNFDLPLAAETVPISATGRFKLKEKTPVEDEFVQVLWKGRWTKPGVVKGSITLKHGGCSSTRKWSGGKVG